MVRALAGHRKPYWLAQIVAQAGDVSRRLRDGTGEILASLEANGREPRQNVGATLIGLRKLVQWFQQIV